MKGIVLVASVVCVTASLAVAQNLLTNGDFNLPNSVANPDGWTAWTYDPNSAGAWANHQNDGSSDDATYYMAIGSDDNGAVAGVYQLVPGQGGTQYTLSIDSGAQAWWQPEAEMRLTFLDASSNVLTQNTLITVNYFGGQYDLGQAWSNFTLTAIAPAGTTQAKVEFAMNGGGGTVWFDNAVLVPEPGTLGLVASGSVLLFGLQLRRRIRRS